MSVISYSSTWQLASSTTKNGGGIYSRSYEIRYFIVPIDQKTDWEKATCNTIDNKAKATHYLLINISWKPLITLFIAKQCVSTVFANINFHPGISQKLK